MAKSNINFNVRATGADLILTVVLDGQQIKRFSPDLEFQKISIEIDDNIEDSHVLELQMSGKTKYHTVLSENGEIIQDRVIEIADVDIEGIEIDYLFTQSSVYSHNFNSTGNPVDEVFYGTMGCNGTVRFSFSTPVYLWLLENM